MIGKLGKSSGYLRVVECNCGYVGDYLYIPSQRTTSMSVDGKKVMHYTKPARIIMTDNYCPGCHCNLAKQISEKEGRARILK